LISLRDIVSIGQCDVKHIMTWVLDGSAYIDYHNSSYHIIKKRICGYMYQCNYFINRTLISNVKMNLQIPKKMDKRTNNNLQNITHKTKDRETRTPLETGSNSIHWLSQLILSYSMYVSTFITDIIYDASFKMSLIMKRKLKQ
jgi:hypothetical protein